MSTDLLRNYAAVRGLISLGLASLCVWEAFRTADKIFRIELVVMALLTSVFALMYFVRSRSAPRPQWPTTTLWPRAAIAVSLFPLGLGGFAVWAFVRYGDVFNLVVGVGVLTMGFWGVALGVKTLRRETHDRA